MTYQDIYTKFMIEYDKANVTSSYPMLTEYEVATILDRAYLALIWQKVSGNNTRRVPFEYDLKAIADIQPLIRTVEKNLTVPDNRIASNIVATSLPTDCLSFVDLVLKQNMSDYPLDKIHERLDKIHERNVPTTLIPHNTVENFLVTPYNMPWIKKPVCFLENNNVNIAYDTISLGTLGSNDKALITYIKQPISFVKSLTNYVEDSGSGTYADFATREWVMENFVRKWKDVYSPESGIIEEIPSQQPTTPDTPSTPDTPTIPDNPVQKRSATWSVTSSKSITLTSVGATSLILVSNPDNIPINYAIYYSSPVGCITVSNSGLITTIVAGTAVIKISSLDTNEYYPKELTVDVVVSITPSPIEDNPTQTENPGNAVDLGLPSGTKWAKMNLNYISEMLPPTDTIGNTLCTTGYFGFGDPTGEVTSLNNSDYGSSIQGVDNTPTDIAGTEYDICTATLGEGWSIPTRELFLELSNNCTWEFINMPETPGVTPTAQENDSQGNSYPSWKATSTINGNVLYFPAAGSYLPSTNTYNLQGSYCFYWTSYSKGSFSAVYAQIIGGITESWLFGDYTNPNDPQDPDTADYRTHMPIRPVYVESN